MKIETLAIPTDLCCAKPDEDNQYFMIANTGKPMRLTGWKYPVVIDLDGVEFAGDVLPVIANHDTREQLGATIVRGVLGEGETRNVKGKEFSGAAIFAEWKFTNSSNDTTKIKENLDNGFPYQVSVGAQPTDVLELKKGETATVNGQEVSGPMYLANKCLVKEVSVVVFGADRHTATVKAQESEDEMSNVTETAPVNNEPIKENKIEEPRKESKIRAEAKEENRLLGIDTVMKMTANQAIGEIEFADGVMFRDVKAAANYAKKHGEISADDFQKAVLEASIKRPAGGLSIGIHVADKSVNEKILAAAILKGYAKEAGIPITATVTKDGTEKYGLEAWFDEKTLEATDRPELQNPTFSTICASLSKHINGYGEFLNCRSSDYEDRVQSIYHNSKSIYAAGGAAGTSSISLDSVWQIVGRAIMLSTSQSVPTTYQQWTKTISVKDFKPTTLMSVGMDGTLAPLGNNGVMEHGTLGETSFTVQTDTYGKMFGITRKELINDEMNVYLSKFRTIGLMVPKTLEQLAYYTLLKNKATYFTQANGNLITGVDSVLSIDALANVLKNWKSRVGFDGQPIQASPDRMLVGLTLETLANTLYTSEFPVTEYKTKGANAQERRYASLLNSVKGRFRPICSSYLDNTAIRQTIFKKESGDFPGQSSTMYFVLSDPNSAEGAAFYVPCLNGSATPHVKQSDFGTGMLGTNVEVYSDFNVVPGDLSLMTLITGEA